MNIDNWAVGELESRYPVTVEITGSIPVQPAIKIMKKKTKKKPIKKLTRDQYLKALQHPKWQKKRLRVFQRDKWRCRMCKDTETTLHVHHLKYTKKYPWNEPMKNLKTLCANCHKKVSKK